jgi:hypothetical protein
MQFVRFLGRHLSAAVAGAVGILLLTLGYADQAANIIAVAEPWQMQARGAALFILCIVLVLYRWEKEQQKHLKVSENAGISHAVSMPAPELAVPKWEMKQDSTAAQHKSPKQKNMKLPRDRVFVGEKISVSFLRNLYRENTTAQADRITQPYKAKWMAISGAVNDIQLQLNGTYYVNVKTELPKEATYMEQISTTLLIFRSNLEALDILHRGDEISAIGQITLINNMALTLDNCELIEAD